MKTHSFTLKSAMATLDAFTLADRLAALDWLIAHGPADAAPKTAGGINLHAHSFFSYNMTGWSPTHIAWASRQAGLFAAGLCDFDVLDGLDEFLQAGQMLGLRATVNLETRAFFPAYAELDINSPGEPGVAYIMGCGFFRAIRSGTPEATILTAYRDQAKARNIALAARINAKLPEIAVDFDTDIAPLTPGGCPTERHMIRAYRLKAETRYGNGEALGEFWGKLFGTPGAEMPRLITDIPGFEEKIRAKLSKSGGLGYEKPTAKTFPPVSDFVRWVLACEAIPTTTWLDGTSGGEADMDLMLDRMGTLGACALNIIPDRNHNIADPKTRTLKVKKLDDVVCAAASRGLPINIGTELNKDGQPFVDDLNVEPLSAYRQIFLDSAHLFVGHTWLARYAGFSYTGKAADAEFGANRKARNRLFQAVGQLAPLTADKAKQLEDMGPAKALSYLRDGAAATL